MRRVLLFTLAFTLLALLNPQTCLAQTDPWERLKLIEPGRPVTVVRLDGKSLNGQLQEWTPEGIALSLSRQRVTRVAKTDVATVALVTGMSRGRRASWAALIGGAIGFGLFGGLCAGGAGDCDISPAAVGAGGALYVGGIGAGVSALIPRHREVIYTAKAGAAAGRKTGALEESRHLRAGREVQ